MIILYKLNLVCTTDFSLHFSNIVAFRSDILYPVASRLISTLLQYSSLRVRHIMSCSFQTYPYTSPIQQPSGPTYYVLQVLASSLHFSHIVASSFDILCPVGSSLIPTLLQYSSLQFRHIMSCRFQPHPFTSLIQQPPDIMSQQVVKYQLYSSLQVRHIMSWRL